MREEVALSPWELVQLAYIQAFDYDADPDHFVVHWLAMQIARENQVECPSPDDVRVLMRKMKK